VYNILEAIGDLGGIFSVIYLFGAGIVTIIAEKMYLANLIREIFRVRTDTQHLDMGELLTAVKSRKSFAKPANSYL
jgi:hypothetical protein